ncbi:AAA family ATPase [Mammaliicoccus sciuri]|uniref:AAA family ATPase n=1 Tax=Mammaliicoccus sciuri TaxID=1296 RepID=UPI00194EC670|nr:AAA family ATPase [Mammaliicoccus sciuri]MCJ0953539.1 AAA family ATPase [Mammaliicoccus sciuri]
MEIKLIKLVLDNFKGAKHFELNAEGKDIVVKGENNTGKTTIADAFYWLLFNKDSKGATKFSIKTLDSAGEEINNLKHSVYAVLNIDGKEHHIKKTYSEKWTRKRGQAKSTFTGHETVYELGATEDELTPKKLKDFNEFINSIISDEQIFKLTTNPFWFNSLKQDERKKILMSLVDEVTDEDVINSDSKLKELKKLIGDGSLEDFKMRISRNKKSINEDLKAIPVRVDEINHNMPDVRKYNKQKLEEELTEINNQIKQIDIEIKDVENGLEIEKIEKDIKSKELDIQYLKDNHNHGNKRELSSLINQDSELQRAIATKRRDLSNLTAELQKNESVMEEQNEKFKALGIKHKELVNEQKEFTTATVCDCCGQDIPEHMQQEAIQKMKENYNADKSERLEKIQSDGIEIRNKVKQLSEQNDEIESTMEVLIEEIEKETKNVEEIKESIKKIESNNTDVKDTDEYKQLDSEIKALKEKKGQSIQSMSEDVQNIVKSKKEPLINQQQEVKQKLDDIQVSQRALDRIKELETKQEQLAQEYNELEHATFLTEEFTKQKVNLMEGSINDKFEITKFKLFDVQINQGVQDVCIATHNGVPFDSGLNNAARINVGLDIINALSKHYNFYAPIMIDNAESVTDVHKTTSQQIQLEVSKKDKALTVEVI